MWEKKYQNNNTTKNHTHTHKYNKNDPLVEEQHIFFLFCSYHFFIVANSSTVSIFEGGEAVGQAAQRTVGTSSTRVCCDHLLVQNTVQSSCKAVTLLVVVSYTDLTFPLHVHYAESRKLHQSSPSLSSTTLEIFHISAEKQQNYVVKKSSSCGFVRCLIHKLL